jgi:hypothetical protein
MVVFPLLYVLPVADRWVFCCVGHCICVTFMGWDLG